MALGEEADDARGDHVADVLHKLELLGIRVPELIKRPEMPRERERRGLAYLPDAERVDEAAERGVSRVID